MGLKINLKGQLSKVKALNLNMTPVFSGFDAVQSHEAHAKFFGKEFQSCFSFRVEQAFFQANDLRYGEFCSIRFNPMLDEIFLRLYDIRAASVVLHHFLACGPFQIAMKVVGTISIQMQHVHLIVGGFRHKELSDEMVQEFVLVLDFSVFIACFVLENTVAIHLGAFEQASVFNGIGVADQSPIVGDGIAKLEFVFKGYLLEFFKCE